jgi:hypothetical protein
MPSRWELPITKYILCIVSPPVNPVLQHLHHTMVKHLKETMTEKSKFPELRRSKRVYYGILRCILYLVKTITYYKLHILHSKMGAIFYLAQKNTL